MELAVTAGLLEAELGVDRGDGFTLDISLTIEPGHTVALLGPNGAGKSTAVSAIAGLTPLDRGYLRLGNVTLDDPERGLLIPPARRRIGVAFQDHILFPHLTVAQNVGFGLSGRRQSREQRRRSVSEWLERLGIADLANRKPRDLSGGQAQRVAMARALVTAPDVLLLDEPLSALDATTRVTLRHVLADHLDGFGGPRMLITHDPTEAFLLADRILIIEAGRITQSGTADDIRIRPRTRYAADLAGSNLLEGTATGGGNIAVEGHTLQAADTTIAGEVLATIHPRAISVHRRRPEGSPRNTWETTLGRVEHYGDRVRLRTGPPMPLTAEITPGAVEALGLASGATVWISIKATEISVEPA